jgi:hypothetical protein
LYLAFRAIHCSCWSSSSFWLCVSIYTPYHSEPTGIAIHIKLHKIAGIIRFFPVKPSKRLGLNPGMNMTALRNIPMLKQKISSGTSQTGFFKILGVISSLDAWLVLQLNRVVIIIISPPYLSDSHTGTTSIADFVPCKNNTTRIIIHQTK